MAQILKYWQPVTGVGTHSYPWNSQTLIADFGSTAYDWSNRVITYERDLTTSATWLKVGEGISRKENGAGHNNEDDYQHINNIRTDLMNYGYTPVYQRYANLSGYDGSSATISSDINSGVGIINYANHGQETAWGANSSGYIRYPRQWHSLCGCHPPAIPTLFWQY